MNFQFCAVKTVFPRPGHIYNIYGFLIQIMSSMPVSTRCHPVSTVTGRVQEGYQNGKELQMWSPLMKSHSDEEDDAKVEEQR